MDLSEKKTNRAFQRSGGGPFAGGHRMAGSFIPKNETPIVQNPAVLVIVTWLIMAVLLVLELSADKS